MFEFAEGTIRKNVGGILQRDDSLETLPIWQFGGPGGTMPVPGPGPYMPMWQMAPVVFGGVEVNRNVIQNYGETGANVSFQTESVTLGKFHTATPGDITSSDPGTSMFALLLSVAEKRMVNYMGEPLSQTFFPVFDSFREDRKAVAVMTAWIHWSSYFKNVLPSSMNGIHIVLHNTCSGAFTFEINGPRVTIIGMEDLHDFRFHAMQRSASFESVHSIDDGTKYGLPLNNDHCIISLDVYPSTAFHDTYRSRTPIVMTAAVAVIFVFTVGVFILYDNLVQRRQTLVMNSAVRSNAIVTSLFPENVRDRLMHDASMTSCRRMGDGSYSIAPTRRLKGYLNGQEEDDADQAPIADLFPHCKYITAAQ